MSSKKKTQNVMTDTIHWLKAKDNAFFVSKQKKERRTTIIIEIVYTILMFKYIY